VGETTSEVVDEIGESISQSSTPLGARTCLISCIDLEE